MANDGNLRDGDKLTADSSDHAVVVSANLAPEAGAGLPWYQGIPRYAWLVLGVAALGWMFDTMDQHLFNLVRQVSVTELIRPEYLHASPKALDDAAKVAGGMVTAIFLIGWAVGGFIFGILGDRIGRTRTMILTICIYAFFTGLNGLVHTMWQYELCRFLTALGVGGEFAAGTALVAEVWPNRSRPMALGTLQALSAVGNIGASFIALALVAQGWRWVYAVGAIPALMVLWIRRSVKEPERWIQARQAAERDGTRRELGNIAELFTDPVLRRNTIAGVLCALAGVGGVWGVAFFLPDLVGTVLKPIIARWPEVTHAADPAKTLAMTVQKYRGNVSIVQQLGAFTGMILFPIISQRTGRKPALFMFFILAFIAVQATFWLLRDPTSAFLLAFPLGVCALAPFSAYSVYFPELYPTRLRSTGIGFCYNCARILAAFAPLMLGRLTKEFGSPEDPTLGFRRAASVIACIYVVGLIGLLFAPETRGKPLPE